MRKLKFILTALLLTLTVFGNLNAQKTETQTKEVPKELKDRLELYWKYTQKEDWENLFYIKDSSILVKEDFVEMMKKEKMNPYRRFNSILEIGLENEMKFQPSSNKWEISGCTKITDRNDKEKWVASSAYGFKNEKNEWIVGIAFPVPGGNFISCDKKTSLFPIKIKVNELK